MVYWFRNEQAKWDLQALLSWKNSKIAIPNAADNFQYTSLNPNALWEEAIEGDVELGLAGLCYSHLVHAEIDLTLGRLWEESAGKLQKSSRLVRGTIARGIEQLVWFQRTTVEKPVDLRIFGTRETEEIDRSLVELAMTFTDDEIRYVSAADRGHDKDEHRKAIEKAIGCGFDNFPLQERWIPMEVLELTSHVPDQIGYLPSLGAVLLDVLRSPNGFGDDFRWSQQSAHLKSLPQKPRTAIIGAMRHAYETDANWNPYDKLKSKEKVQQAMLPWDVFGEFQ